MKELQNLLDSLQLQSGASWRGDCVVCGNKNTLSVSKELGRYKWYCFHASCGTKGELKGKLDNDDLTRMVVQLQNSLSRIDDIFSVFNSDSSGSRIFPIPDYWVPAYSRTNALNYLKRFPLALRAYSEERIDVRYDPRLNRIVFLIQHKGETFGAAGRALDVSTVPKWYIYHHDLQIPFRSTSNKLLDGGALSEQVVLVEDCISASCASSFIDSFALLGTNIPEAYYSHFSGYSKVIIALDKDASKKSLKLQKQLAPFFNTQVILLEEDLKYLTEEEIRKCLRL